MREIIQSSSNKIIKHIKSLQQKKYRDESDSFLIEGEKLVLEALEYKAGISKVLFSQSFCSAGRHNEIVNILLKGDIPFYYAEDRVFREACETDTPQGVIAVAGKLEYNLAGILERDALCIVMLNELRDPGNAGTIIRTADACGLDAVLLSKGSVDLYNGKTIRSTMGSLFHIPVFQNVDTIETVELLKKKGIVTVGADPHSNTDCIDFPYYRKTAIIIGNEAQGLDENTKSIFEHNVRIPMTGRAESLNAGIAASIMMYEFSVRKRYAK